MLVIVSCNEKGQKESLVVQTKFILHSNSDTLYYAIDDEENRNGWIASPELQLDVLPLECETQRKITMYSKSDSVQYFVNKGDTIRFHIVLSGKDSAYTEIVGVEKNTNFSDQYVQENKGKFKVEVPEVHELVNIAFALTDVGIADMNMVEHDGDYYEKVMKHFRAFKDHPLIQEMNQHMTEPLANESYYYYFPFRLDACSYSFSENGSIQNNNIIRKMSVRSRANAMEENIALLEDFAKESNFRTFFKDNQDYYNHLISEYKVLNPINDMKAWCEEKFNMSYGSYWIMFSPLVGGAHATQAFEDNGFEQTIMFVCAADRLEKYDDAMNEMRASRVVFTEIDHNFVNPISGQYFEEIEASLSNRTIWATEGNRNASYYTSPFMVFNEYMTWAVFSLYCYDRFGKEKADQYLKGMIWQMEDDRGFPLFGEFNEKLIQVYQNKAGDMHQIFDEMLAWCAMKNKLNT